MISSELLKGSLRTIVLKVIKEEGPLHGYAITRKVEKLTGGRIKLTYGALYPVLHKLKSEGVLATRTETFNNRLRIQYTLTDRGQSMASEKIKELSEFIESLKRIIEPGNAFNYV